MRMIASFPCLLGKLSYYCMILLLVILGCPSDNEGPLGKGRHNS